MAATTEHDEPEQPSIRFSLTDLLAATAVVSALLALFRTLTTDSSALTFAATVTSIPLLVIYAGLSRRRPHVFLLGLFLIPLSCSLLPAGLWSPGDGVGRRSLCENNLHQIMLAIHMHCVNRGSVAPRPLSIHGAPAHSWRAKLMPELGEAALAQQYNRQEPWNGPNNRLLHRQSISLLHCPSDRSLATNTSYVAVVGKGTAWDGKGGFNLHEIKRGDGLSNTACLIEVANSGIHWLEPRDISRAVLFRAPVGLNISSTHPAGGAHVAMADGSVRFVSNQATPVQLRAIVTANGGDKVDLPE